MSVDEVIILILTIPSLYIWDIPGSQRLHVSFNAQTLESHTVPLDVTAKCLHFL